MAMTNANIDFVACAFWYIRRSKCTKVNMSKVFFNSDDIILTSICGTTYSSWTKPKRIIFPVKIYFP